MYLLDIKSSAPFANWIPSNRPAALENTAQSVLCTRNRALEIAARARREVTWRSKPPLEHAFSCSATLANAAPALAL